MKRLATFLLSLAMAFTLTACGDAQKKMDRDPGSVSPQPETAEPEAEQSAEILAPFCKTADIEETVLLDEGGVRVTATGLEYSSYSADLKLTIENNSGENLDFTSGTLGYGCNSINGIMVADGYLSCDVAAGKKAVDTISFHDQVMQLYGIQEIESIEIGLTLTDEEYNSTNYPPKEIKTSAWSGDDDLVDFQDTITGAAAQNTFDYEVLFFGTDRLYEESGMVILSQTLIRNKDGEQILLVEAENQGEHMNALSVSDIAMNNLLVESGTWTRQLLAPGKKGILSINLSNTLEEAYWDLYGIESIGSIKFAVQQYGLDGLPLSEKKPVEVLCGEKASLDHDGDIVYQGNEAAIVLKSVMDPETGGGSCLNVLLLAENKGQNELKLEIPFEALSVNGYMVDYFGDQWELEAGQSAMMEIQLAKSDLDEIGVTAADQIRQVEFEMEIYRGKTILDNPAIQLNFNEAE